MRGNGGVDAILGLGWFKRPSAEFLDQECKAAYGAQWRVWEAEHWQEWLYAVWTGTCKLVQHQHFLSTSTNILSTSTNILSNSTNILSFSTNKFHFYQLFATISRIYSSPYHLPLPLIYNYFYPLDLNCLSW